MNEQLRKCVPERRPLALLLKNLQPLAKDAGRAGKYTEDVQALLDYFVHPLNGNTESWAIVSRMDASIDDYTVKHGEFPHPARCAFYLGRQDLAQLRYIADRMTTYRCDNTGRRPEYRGIQLFEVDAPEYLRLA